jgi:hypothetical protein
MKRDTLSGWTDPPPAARASGDAEPIRCFETAEDALRFLAAQDRSTGAAARSTTDVAPGLMVKHAQGGTTALPARPAL